MQMTSWLSHFKDKFEILKKFTQDNTMLNNTAAGVVAPQGHPDIFQAASP